MKKLTNDQLAMMLLQSAMEQGFELEMAETIEQNMLLAEEYLLENVEADFEYCEFTGGYSQGYYFCDEFGKDTQVSGEIFDFGKDKAESEVYYHIENDGEFKPVDWFEIPMEGEAREEGRALSRIEGKGDHDQNGRIEKDQNEDGEHTGENFHTSTLPSSSSPKRSITNILTRMRIIKIRERAEPML